MIRFLFAILFCVGISATAQEVASRVTVENTSPQTQSYPDYVLGPGDQIRIHVVNVDEVPKDPITDNKDWNIVTGDDPYSSEGGTGVTDVHSSSSEVSTEGTPYSEW